ncbi:hypothetical protein EDD85DRAFT_797380 [Armillaria nabsnona]|nr:hypothetical protein EDD85DRAFT_797380 [Armillaria nabsnona]
MSSTSPIQSSFPIELIEEILDRANCLPAKDIQSILRHSSGGYNILSDEYREGTIYSGCEDPEGDDYWIHKVLPNFALSLFADIRLLTIHAARFDYISEEDFAKTLNHLSGPTTITHLAIRYCVFWTQDHLTQALSSIKSLDAVNMCCPTLRTIPERDDKTQSLLPTLPASVSLLMINIDSAENIVWIARIISVTVDNFYNALNFDCHPNLEIIAFDSLSLGTRANKLDGRMKNRHVPAILRKITTSSIREVILNLTGSNSKLEDPDDLDSLDLETMGEILRRKNYSKLEVLGLLRVDCHIRPKVKKILAERMRGLNQPISHYMSHERGMVMLGLFGW